MQQIIKLFKNFKVLSSTLAYVSIIIILWNTQSQSGSNQEIEIPSEIWTGKIHFKPLLTGNRELASRKRKKRTLKNNLCVRESKQEKNRVWREATVKVSRVCLRPIGWWGILLCCPSWGWCREPWALTRVQAKLAGIWVPLVVLYTCPLQLYHSGKKKRGKLQWPYSTHSWQSFIQCLLTKENIEKVTFQ
jgi:hypothetical protein